MLMCFNNKKTNTLPVRKYYQEYAWNLDGLRPEIVKKSDFPAIARRTWNSEKNRLGKSEYPP